MTPAEFMALYPAEYDDGRAFEQFLRDYPQYLGTAALSRRRARDFHRLDERGEVYLDYTGAGLYGDWQVHQHTAWLLGGTYGNPHSVNPTSLRSTQVVEEARQAVLRFFGADPAVYTVIFTANASAAIKLVGEAYPFGRRRPYCYLVDNHNSVVGLRELAKTRRAPIRVPLVARPDLAIDHGSLIGALATRPAGLFAYPAQSNFSGTQHALNWVTFAQNLGWDVLLDVAAFAPNNPLSFSEAQPDFASLSFYKLFGWPTGVGCLIAKHTALAKLRRPAFAGGTIDFVSVLGDQYKLTAGASGFEDGTLNFLNLKAVTLGLQYLQAVGMNTIHARVTALTGWLLRELADLRHHGGRPVVELYGTNRLEARGATLALSFLASDGTLLDERLVERLAAERGISLRTGCFCNPGTGEVAFNVDHQRLRGLTRVSMAADANMDTLLQYLGIPTGGAVRVSLGQVTTFRDAERFMAFAASFCDRPPDGHQFPPREHC